jgi:hypothetical protein
MAKRREDKRAAAASAGRMIRPKAVVLGEAALVPSGSRVKPPPNQFTHVVTRRQPFFFGDTDRPPDGEFAAGARIVLMVFEGGPTCRVIDEQGLYVQTAYEGLRPL